MITVGSNYSPALPDIARNSSTEAQIFLEGNEMGLILEITEMPIKLNALGSIGSISIINMHSNSNSIISQPLPCLYFRFIHNFVEDRFKGVSVVGEPNEWIINSFIECKMQILVKWLCEPLMSPIHMLLIKPSCTKIETMSSTMSGSPTSVCIRPRNGNAKNSNK